MEYVIVIDVEKDEGRLQALLDEQGALVRKYMESAATLSVPLTVTPPLTTKFVLEILLLTFMSIGSHPSNSVGF